MLACECWSSFNPRPRVEGDLHGLSATGFTPRPRGRRLGAEVVCASQQQFQSTPSRGGRPMTSGSMTTPSSFNPRPRVEGDSPRRLRVPTGSFNPHPRGGDLAALPRMSSGVFRPHPRAEGDVPAEHLNTLLKCFNPRPRVEGDTEDFVGVTIYPTSIRALA